VAGSAIVVAEIMVVDTSKSYAITFTLTLFIFYLKKFTPKGK
jgi:hypothetical protein